MSGVRGALVATMGLSLLQVVVSSQAASNNANGLITFVTNGLARWLNPYVPLIPDLRPPDKRGTTVSLFPLGGSITIPDVPSLAPPVTQAPAPPAAPTPHK